MAHQEPSVKNTTNSHCYLLVCPDTGFGNTTVHQQHGSRATTPEAIPGPSRRSQEWELSEQLHLAADHVRLVSLGEKFQIASAILLSVPT
jgi:hypothetical protein